MGLGGGEHGVKAVTKRIFHEAVAEMSTLEAVRVALEKKSSETVVVMDGNVLLRSTPDAISTLEGYVEYSRRQIDRAFAAGDHVVMVFDEPENLTKAKAAEQARRDAQRKKTTSQSVVVSEDIQKLPSDDNYLISSLPVGFPAKDVILLRGARSRVFDHVAMALFARYKKALAQMLPGAPFKSFTIDGVDGRGGDRAVGDQRRSGLISTLPEADRIFARTQPIGEGDLKMSVVVDELSREVSSSESPIHGVNLFLLSTVDTDSIVIELLSHARRVAENGSRPSVFLCLRERAKRGRDGEDAAGFFTVFDIDTLQNEVLRYLFPGETRLDVLIKRKVLTLFAMGAIMCGTDFVEFKGLRFNEILEIIKDVCINSITSIAGLNGAWSPDDSQLLRLAATVKQLLDIAAQKLDGVPRRWKSSASLRNPDCGEISRTLWNVSYWSDPFRERKATEYWGFPIVFTGTFAPGHTPTAAMETVDAPVVPIEVA